MRSRAPCERASSGETTAKHQHVPKGIATKTTTTTTTTTATTRSHVGLTTAPWLHRPRSHSSDHSGSLPGGESERERGGDQTANPAHIALRRPPRAAAASSRSSRSTSSKHGVCNSLFSPQRVRVWDCGCGAFGRRGVSRLVLTAKSSCYYGEVSNTWEITRRRMHGPGKVSHTQH